MSAKGGGGQVAGIGREATPPPAAADGLSAADELPRRGRVRLGEVPGQVGVRGDEVRDRLVRGLRGDLALPGDDRVAGLLVGVEREGADAATGLEETVVEALEVGRGGVLGSAHVLAV